MRGVDPDLDHSRWPDEGLPRRKSPLTLRGDGRAADAVVMHQWTRAGAMSARGLAVGNRRPRGGNVHHGDVINTKRKETATRLRRIRRTVTTVGVKDLVVVQTKRRRADCRRHAVQDVKKVVEKDQGRRTPQAPHAPRVYPPVGQIRLHRLLGESAIR